MLNQGIQAHLGFDEDDGDDDDDDSSNEVITHI